VGKRVFILMMVVTMAGHAPAEAHAFQTGEYAAPDGALLLHGNDVAVEPYFATKALLVAADAGLDIQQPAVAWIEWLLPRQHHDGRFDRYCRQKENKAKTQAESWTACGAADADDSLLALWIELLYRAAPQGALPARWQQSADSARHYLASLKNSRMGVYYVSRKNHAALFMDNVEVYSALKEMSRAEGRMGQKAAAGDEAEAEKLAQAIRKVFWNERAGRYLPSNQRTHPAFYPDVVAQVFPALADLPAPGGDERQAWARWKQSFERAWQENRYDPHAWGLVAVAALKEGDNATAECWLERAGTHRGDSQWNILEEASFQAVTAQVLQPAVASNCLQPGATP